MPEPHDEEMIDFSFDPDLLDGILDQTDEFGAPSPEPEQEFAAEIQRPAITPTASDLPVYMAGGFGDYQQFVEDFLEHVAPDFTSRGMGHFDCYWQWRYNVDEEAVRRYSSTVRAAISRLRARAGTGDTSIVSLLRWEIQPCQRLVRITYMRVTREVWAKMQGAQRKLAAAKRTKAQANLLKHF